MEEILKTAASQVPGLVVLAMLVAAFLKRDKEREDTTSKANEQRDAFIKLMHNEHLVARAESREAMRDNAEATRRNADATIENTEVLRALRSDIQNNKK